jgi:prevent-host-death family protein
MLPKVNVRSSFTESDILRFGVSDPGLTTMVMEAYVEELQLHEAKATLSAVVDQARAGQPSVITRHGRPEAVVVSFKEWRRLFELPSVRRQRRQFPPRQDRMGTRAASMSAIHLRTRERSNDPMMTPG